MKNQSREIEFILLGLTDEPQLQIVIFIFLFLNYMLIIDHFICDTSPLLHISCTDTHFLELVSFILAGGTLMVTLLLVVFSYTSIIKTVLKIPSAEKRTKAFSTCSSHMIVVSLTYGSCIFIHMKPSAKERLTLSKGVAVIYTSVVPLLNPFIYTLRNQPVKQVYKDTLQKLSFFFIKMRKRINFKILEKK
ncbi:hypothetical protein HPG69_015024 [Diceros bicornis minor]|uniref:G-protein coupled receptors family 1 profile domain-containing protein n=1 Tax=Diceros bicornis minor TaxID=77932 RepID=A0A7J7FK46_DICBM|nr:hypothetical protein HPG69_015024 [Diceros bicornis minor]